MQNVNVNVMFSGEWYLVLDFKNAILNFIRVKVSGLWGVGAQFH